MRLTGRQFHNQPEASHTHGFLVALWDEVAQRTDGAVKISVHAQNGGLPGSDPAALEMLVSGELELMALMGGILGQVVPDGGDPGLAVRFPTTKKCMPRCAASWGPHSRGDGGEGYPRLSRRRA